MARERNFITIGCLLDEHGETEQAEEIVERVKILAQEHLPEGWTQWEVSGASKQQIFGDKIEPNVLNKLVFALPTVGLARAFNPEADHLSEKGYREMRYKLLDWAFTRALILGPPAIANRIRGSALNTELFKQSVEVLRPLLHTRAEADKILSGNLSASEETSRRRRSCSLATEGSKTKKRRTSPSPSTSQYYRIDALERKMEDMFSTLLEKFEARPALDPDSDKENDCEESEDSSNSDGDCSWRAPTLDPYLDISCQDLVGELEFAPRVKEADPLIPEPNPDIKREGIECQRLNSDGWSRIRYKEVEKHLHASPVFSALKVNVELGGLLSQPSPWLTKQEGMLGTISHGLLLQRKALAEGLNAIVRKCPGAGEELRLLLSQDSQFKVISDNLLQYVCAHRAETIELRRKVFRGRNEILNGALHNINPSSTHLFEEKLLNSFIKDNGGLAQVFPTNKFAEKRDKTRETFRKPGLPMASTRGKQQAGRSRSATARANPSGRHVPSSRPMGNSKYANRNHGQSGKDKRSHKRRKY